MRYWNSFKHVGTTWVYKSVSTIHFMKSKYRSIIANENIVS